MDAKGNSDPAGLSTVADYAAAIQRVSSGQFTSRMSEIGQRFFASIYGAPLFALARFAPEAMASRDNNLIVISSDPAHAVDGGRWWSLYAKIHTPSKFSLTLCFPHKPPTGRAPKPLLFQPPQQVVKSWQKHLQALAAPPCTVVFYPKSFDELETATNEFISSAPGRKVLVSCYTRLDSLIARCLVVSHGYITSDIIGFHLSEDEPQQFASGAWWFSAIVPTDRNSVPDKELVEKLRIANLQLSRLFLLTDKKEDREVLAGIVATRASDVVQGEEVQTVRLSDCSGIDLASGRFFKKNEDGDGGHFIWDDTVMSADLLALQPSARSETTEEEDRLALLLWISHAAAQETKRELEKITGDEPTLPITSGSAATPESSSDATAEDPAAAAKAIDTGSVVQICQPVTDAPAPAPIPASTPQPVETENTQIGTNVLTRNRSRLSRSAGTVNVLALAAILGREGEPATALFDAAKAQILAWLLSIGFTLEKSDENCHVESPSGEVTVETDGQSIWAMRFDNRSTMETGAIWRVEATLIGQPVPAISLRLIQVRSSEDAPPPIISGVPRLIVAISEKVGLQDAGEQLRNTAMHLKHEGDSIWLGRLLLNPHRTQPVIVISGKVDASADRLAKRLSGVAHVVCIDHAASSRMIRVFGRERSVFGNAVRMYRPGFSADANPYQHPTWALKGAQLPNWLANNIFEEACAISLEGDDLDDRAPSFQSVRSLLATKRMASSEQRIFELRKQAEKAASSKEERIRQLQAVRDEQDDVLGMYREENDKLTKLSEQLKRDLQAALLERDTALEEVRQLSYRINNQWADEDAPETSLSDESYYPNNWDELEEWVDSYGDGKLVLHEKALKAVKSSPFKDIPFAYKALEYLVRYFVPMKQRDPDDDAPFQAEIIALEELGLEREPVGDALKNHRYKQSYRRLYEGNAIWLDDHLKWGGGFDPATLFRLYFHYHEASGKVIVGHLTTHLPNSLTHTS